MARILRMYLDVLKRRPLITQAVSTGVLMGTGDVIAQFAVERKTLDQFEIQRPCRFLLFGMFLGGPSLRGWYLILERVYKGTSKTVALKKVVTDQIVMAPLFLTVFLATMTYWRTKSIDVVEDKFKKDYVAILLANYKLWPAAQMINFYMVPLQHRIMFVNIVALFWNTFLAYKANREDDIQTEEINM